MGTEHFRNLKLETKSPYIKYTNLQEGVWGCGVSHITGFSVCGVASIVRPELCEIFESFQSPHLTWTAEGQHWFRDLVVAELRLSGLKRVSLMSIWTLRSLPQGYWNPGLARSIRIKQNQWLLCVRFICSHSGDGGDGILVVTVERCLHAQKSLCRL